MAATCWVQHLSKYSTFAHPPVISTEIIIPKIFFYPQCVNFILTLLPCRVPCRVTGMFRVMGSLKITAFYNRNWCNSCITSNKL